MIDFFVSFLLSLCCLNSPGPPKGNFLEDLFFVEGGGGENGIIKNKKNSQPTKDRERVCVCRNIYVCIYHSGESQRTYQNQII